MNNKKFLAWLGDHKLIYSAVAALIFIGLVVVLAIIKKSVNPVVYQRSDDALAPLALVQSYQVDKTPQIIASDNFDGKKNNPVKIVVYEDYANPFSATFAVTLEQAKHDFNNQLQIAYRPFIDKDNAFSLKTAMAVACARDQGKWSEMRQEIFKATQGFKLSDSQILVIAGQIGLNQAQFSQCLTSPEKQGIILQAAGTAKQFSVIGVPTFFVDNQMITGARPYNDYTDSNGEKVLGLKNFLQNELAVDNKN